MPQKGKIGERERRSRSVSSFTLVILYASPVTQHREGRLWPPCHVDRRLFPHRAALARAAALGLAIREQLVFYRIMFDRAQLCDPFHPRDKMVRSPLFKEIVPVHQSGVLRGQRGKTVERRV